MQPTSKSGSSVPFQPPEYRGIHEWHGSIFGYLHQDLSAHYDMAVSSLPRLGNSAAGERLVILKIAGVLKAHCVS